MKLDVTEQQLKIIDVIIGSIDYKNMMVFGKELVPMEFYIACRIPGIKNIQMFGRIVQIRKKAGAFGSDLIFFRMLDGSLTTWENQSFIGLNNYQKMLADRIITKELLELDEYEPVSYTIGGKHERVGRIIDPENNYRDLDESPRMKITVTKADGSKEITIC